MTERPFEPIPMSEEDASMLDAQRFAAAEIAGFFGAPADQADRIAEIAYLQRKLDEHVTGHTLLEVEQHLARLEDQLKGKAP